MRQFIDTYKQTKHLDQAYLVSGDVARAKVQLENFLQEDLSITCSGNPDYAYEEYETFGVEQSRILKRKQSLTSMAGKQRFFVIAITFMTTEAQNALLKVFEEPAEGVHFFILTPQSDMLIDTLRSRFQHLHIETDDGSPAGEKDRFSELSISARMKIVQKILKDKNKIEALRILDEIESDLAKQKISGNPEVISALNDVLSARKYIYGKAPSLKMIVEHLVYVVPVLKP